VSDARWPRYAAAGLGFLWFLSLGGWHTLHPTDTSWILAGDWRQHWLGWLFFRDEPWTFPIGTVTKLLYPVGSNIGFTDSNPLMSILFKPFSGWLPAEFQFMGPWLAACFVLQGYMGAALSSTVTKDPGQQMLGGYLFVLSPVLLARLGHDTLSAHWLILGLLYLGLREYPDARSARRATWLSMAAVMFAAGTHPYLTAMCFALAQASTFRLWRTKLVTTVQAVAVAVATTTAMVAIWYVIGYMGDAQVGSGGWGLFTADLLTFVDGAGVSKIFPKLMLVNGQWEGLGFLGLGGVVAAVIAIVAWARLRPAGRTGTWIVIATCVAMGVYALSVNVRMDGEHIARMHTFYKWFPVITSTFRASGRFIWPLHYLVLLFGIWGVTRLWKQSRATTSTAALAVIVVMQGTDLQTDPAQLAAKQFRQTPHAAFAPAAGRYQHMALYPMQVLGACFDEYQEDHVYRFMLEAARLHVTYNSGIFARVPKGQVEAACRALDAQVATGTLDPQTIYVVAPDLLPVFRSADAACGRIDGDWICVSRDSDERFRTYVRTGQVK
jgi:hypothetical protein